MGSLRVDADGIVKMDVTLGFGAPELRDISLHFRNWILPTCAPAMRRLLFGQHLEKNSHHGCACSMIGFLRNFKKRLSLE